MNNDRITVERVPYTGRVYGFSVPPHRIIRTRRNGKECWTGNSGRDIGGYTAEQQPGRGGERGAKKLCFPAHQRVRTLEGQMRISHIVEQRKPVLVWACDDDGVWGYHRVCDWHVRTGRTEELLRMEVRGAFCDADSKKTMVRCLYPTRNHEIYLYTGEKIRADEVCAGDWVTTFGYEMTKHQRSILFGSMLGDGSVAGNDGDFHEMHSVKQKYYVDWKADCLSLLMTNASRTGPASKAGYEGCKRVAYITIQRPDITCELRSLFYSEGTKRVTDEVLSELDDLAVAVWLLDDGYIGNRAKKKGQVRPTGKIATMGFPESDIDKLVDWLVDRYDASATRTKANAIYLSPDLCWGLVQVVSEWIPYTAIPKSKRWLRAEVQRRQASKPPHRIDNEADLGRVPALVTAVDPYCPQHPTAKKTGFLPLYDLTVEGVHRYCASNILVSNSGFDVGALLSHGAHEVIKDAMLVRGTKNEDFWNALRLGRPLPKPDVPFIYDKFMSTLKAGGINTVKKGDIISIMPMTNKDIDGVTSGEVKSSAQVDSKNLEPIPGGLFDPQLTGGLQGKKWTHIQLAEPMPNPVMEEAIRRILGLRVVDYIDILAGRKELNGLTGGKAIERELRNLDVDSKIKELTNTVKTKRGATRDNAVKALRYLRGAQKQNINPGDWVIDKIPVLPPVFRPISVIGDIIRASDMNGLYRDVIEINNSIEELRNDVSEESLTAEKEQLYKAITAAFGLGDPITPEGQSKRWAGAVRQVIGTSPKYGLFQSKVLSKTVDSVARGVVAPDPNLDMDSIGIPEDKAWELYRPHIQRRLVRRGFPPAKAAELIENRSKEAEFELNQEMEERPVIMDRAPTWHKFNLLSFYPHMVKDEDVIRVSPLIVSGFNMDFDGDAANFHVPITDKAVEQAKEKMLPSKNLFRVTDLRSVQHAPSKEMVMGLYQMTRKSKKAKKPMVFPTVAAAKKAYNQGLISVDDPIIIEELQ